MLLNQRESKHITGHSFHLVTYSPWPTIVSISLFNSIIGIALILHNYSIGKVTAITSIMLLIVSCYRWFEDITRESRYLGDHSKKVIDGIKIGFVLFLLSEIALFSSFFFSWFFSQVNHSIPLGGRWPGFGIELIDPKELPLLNTLILLLSGITCTIAHNSLQLDKKDIAVEYLIYTVILALLFTVLQGIEYSYTNFDISDGVFSSIFFSTTFLHGLHVVIGTIFLLTAGLRIYHYNSSTDKHIHLEFAIIYFHIVDIVWLWVLLIYYL